MARVFRQVHSSYGGSAVEDWISKETLGDGMDGHGRRCPCTLSLAVIPNLAVIFCQVDSVALA
jgi:hypothetical protein